VSVPTLRPDDQTASVLTASALPVPAVGRRSRLGRFLTPGLLLASDLAAANLAFVVAWYLRYELMLGGDVEPFDYLPYEVYAPPGLALGGLLVVIFALRSLYRRHQAAFWLDDAFSILGLTGFAVMLLFAATTMVRYPASSRLVFVFVWVLTTVFATLGRVLVQVCCGWLYRHNVGTERVVVVGDNLIGRMVMQGIAAQPHLGLTIVGFVADERDDDFGRFRYLGPVEAIDQVCREHRVDQVVIALPSTSHELQLKMVEHCRQANVGFKLVPDLFEMSLSRIDLDTVSGVPLIGLKEVSIEGWDLLRKRVLDLTLTLVALIPLGLLMGLVAALVRLDSPGPIIYRQTRIGKGGQPFTIFKFRSMRDGADRELGGLLADNEQEGPIFKQRNDPRMTRAGRLIRRASLDELPQLFNVLRGEMSLVGPRPPLPREVELYEAWHRKRLQVAPGLTGLWQVSGRSNVNFEEMVMFDLTYVQNWSIGLDLSILIRTLPAVIYARGAF
jgi:exopolysaccharide biosynthesis polyprenyl glycosylphosphotransferase